MHFSPKPLPEDAAVRYVIDTKGSAFVVQAFATGLLSAFGHDLKIGAMAFSGDVEFVPSRANFDDCRLSVSISAGSLEVINDVSDSDRAQIQQRMRQEVLETDSYPDITYECSRVIGSGNGDRYWLALNGELTLHGINRPLPVSARVIVNGDSLRASGDFTIRMSDFQIQQVSAAAGTIRVKNELKCTFDVVARKQP